MPFLLIITRTSPGLVTSRATMSLLGGKFSNFIFCDGQHRTAFDYDYLREVLISVGFSEVVEVQEGESRLYGANVPRYELEDGSNSPHSLYIEAFK